MQVITQFLDNNLSCPPEIPDCINLRNQYNQELHQLAASGGCMNCQIRKLKERWILKLQELLKP